MDQESHFKQASFLILMHSQIFPYPLSHRCSQARRALCPSNLFRITGDGTVDEGHQVLSFSLVSCSALLEAPLGKLIFGQVLCTL